MEENDGTKEGLLKVIAWVFIFIVHNVDAV